MARNNEKHNSTSRTPRARRYCLHWRSIIVAFSAYLAVASPAAAQGDRHLLNALEPTRPSTDGGGGVIGGGRSSPGCHNYQNDDGTMENSYGGSTAWEVGYLVRFDALPTALDIESISLAWGRSQSPAVVEDGSLAHLYVWDDPNDDGNPLDAVLLHSQSAIVQGSGTDTIVEYTLSSQVPVSGVFYVGMSIHLPGDIWRAAIGADSTAPVAGQSWYIYDGSDINEFDLANNDTPPSSMYPYRAVLRASGCPRSSITYQGSLTESGVAANGAADLRFRVYSASVGGLQLGSTIERAAVPVADGLFSVELNLGSITIDGSGLWLEIDAAFPSGGVYSTLAPRQKITAAPHALFAATTGPHTHTASDLPANLPTTDGANTWNGTNTWAGAATYTSRPAFNGGTSGSDSPFTVDSTFNVTNLNADLLDGNDSAAFARLLASNAFGGTANTFSGSVGIGLTTPWVRLHVSGGTDAAVGSGGYLMTGPINGNNIVMDDNEIMARANGAVAPLYLQAEGGDLIFGDETVGGFVGINTTSPAADLHIRGTDTTCEVRVTPNSAENTSQIRLSENLTGTFATILRHAGVGNKFQIFGVDGGTEVGPHMTVLRDSGLVGIGREPSTNRLEVEGNASKTTSGSWLANSDRRIKRDIATIDGALETLDKLRLVSFRYTNEYRAAHPAIDDRDYVNVIAQEFAEVFPDWVKPSGEKLPDGGEILQVDTYPVTIYTAAAVQELHRKLQERDERIVSLEARLERLEAMLHPAPRTGDGRP